MGEGKRLYAAYNCAPCHGVNGGGAIGPPLIDDKWIYGAGADQIYATISQGRPNGMPSFGGHVTDAADLAARRLRAVDGRPGQGHVRPVAQRRSDGGPARIAAAGADARADRAPLMLHLQSIVHPAGVQAARDQPALVGDVLGLRGGVAGRRGGGRCRDRSRAPWDVDRDRHTARAARWRSQAASAWSRCSGCCSRAS